MTARVNAMGVEMLHRRTFVSRLGCAGIAAAAIGTAASAWAQRPAQPIARPPRPRPGRPLMPGRFNPDAGVASGPLSGVYVVVDVDTKAETLRLRDEGGRTGIVHVNEDMFDLESLKPGDEVEVDFMVPDPGDTRLEAGGLWKVQR
ncbi:MAG: hypothetical protein ABWZ88_12860 [Variovorax sp.]